MEYHTFKEYLQRSFPSKNSGTPASYIMAVKILDELLHKENVFNLNTYSLFNVKDPVLIEKIIDYVVEEEDKYRRKESSIFDLINLIERRQTSYPLKRFCSSAIKKFGEYINNQYANEVSQLVLKSNLVGSDISTLIQKRFKIDDKGTEKEIRVKRRVGQEIFRTLLLKIYSFKCCLTGIDIPQVLRASHIIPWAENKKTRLNPQNGLCLSATYDAAFDKYLLSFDEDYRLILSPFLKEEYTSDTFKRYFLSFEGKKIELPSNYIPSQKFLEKHREKLIV